MSSPASSSGAATTWYSSWRAVVRAEEAPQATPEETGPLLGASESSRASRSAAKKKATEEEEAAPLWKRLALKVGRAWSPWANLPEIMCRARASSGGGAQGGARLECLDGIRGLAFLWVANAHLGDGIERVVETLVMDGALNADTNLSSKCEYFGGICNGDYGVTLFFVLSGFLIPYIIMTIYRKDQQQQAAKPAQSGGVSFLAVTLKFWWRRILRIVPALWASVGYAMLYGYYLSSDSITYDELFTECTKRWWTNFVFVMNMTQLFFTDNIWCFKSLWSVSVEMQFYLFSPLVALAYVHHPRWGYCAATAVVVASVACRFAISNYLWRVEGYEDDSSIAFHVQLYASAWCRASEYAAGILLFMAYDYRMANHPKLLAHPDEHHTLGHVLIDPRLTGMTILPPWLLEGAANIRAATLWWLLGGAGAGDPSAGPGRKLPPEAMVVGGEASEEGLALSGEEPGEISWPVEWELLRWSCMVVAALVGLYCAYFNESHLWPSALNDSVAFKMGFFYPIQYPAVAGLTAVLTWWGLTEVWWPWTALLCSPALYVIASLSYTGYLLQYTVAFMTTGLYPATWSTDVTYGRYTVMYLTLLGINLAEALVFSLLVERPFMKLR